MNFNEPFRNLAGEWTGNNLLRLGWLTPPEYISQSKLSIALEAQEKFLSIKYTWAHENVPQEGLLLVGYDTKQNIATAAWIDSWHQRNAVMFCRGTIDQRGTIDLRGSYKAPPGPDWGWRIIILTPSSTELQILMYNCSPEGVEDLAARAEYKRS